MLAKRCGKSRAEIGDCTRYALRWDGRIVFGVGNADDCVVGEAPAPTRTSGIRLLAAPGGC